MVCGYLETKFLGCSLLSSSLPHRACMCEWCFLAVAVDVAKKKTVECVHSNSLAPSLDKIDFARDTVSSFFVANSLQSDDSRRFEWYHSSDDSIKQFNNFNFIGNYIQ